MTVPLAHSPPRDGSEGDPYARHVLAVKNGAEERTKTMLRYAINPPSGMLDAIIAAATFHDLGKLDPDTQSILQRGRGGKLRWDHIDAGVAHLSGAQQWMASWLVRAHHPPGLPEKQEHFNPDNIGRKLRGRRRDDNDPQRHAEQEARTNEHLSYYLQVHQSAVGNHELSPQKPIHGLTMRLALSCLVDADHSDTAFFDTGREPPESPKPRWAERLEALCDYVRHLPTGESHAERMRNRDRAKFFKACLDSTIDEPIATCEAPVGLGKTTAVSAYLIQLAIKKGLRRLIIVAPFTNILTQTASRLRRALVLPGEVPEDVVLELHHRVDLANRKDRDLCTLWDAPVVLTTAVAFFETLAACHPGDLRKLHFLPGSVVFLDEAHAALPVKLWPQNWRWITELAKDWGCRFVLASGSLARFWESGVIINKLITLPELLPKTQAPDVFDAERRRLQFKRLDNGQVLEPQQLIDHIVRATGPRLVILNTVQNAAVIARDMRAKGLDVLHLSTALTPRDRQVIYDKILLRLQFPSATDWTLVATSCVEAGVDFSFRTAFRERFSTASIIQVAGRVNRNGEYTNREDVFVYDFTLTGPNITQHPVASVSADVLLGQLKKNLLNTNAPADVVTAAMTEELAREGGLGADLLTNAERERNYPKVQCLGKIITTDTRFVVIDDTLKCKLEIYEKVGIRELLEGSVQLWAKRIDTLNLTPVKSRKDVYQWNDTYDPDFLGYMAGVFQNKQFFENGGAII